MTRKETLIRSSLSVSFVMLTAKVLGFLRDMLMANYMGTSATSDIFYLGTAIISTFAGFLCSPLSASYLPIATDVQVRNADQQQHFLGSVYGKFTVMGVTLGLITAVCFHFLGSYMTPGFSENMQNMLRMFLYLQCFIIPVMMLDIINDGNLKLVGRIGFSEASAGIISVVYILYLVIWRKNITLMGLGLCGIAAYTVSFVLKYLVAASQLPIGRWNFKFWDCPETKKITKAMLPFMVACGATEINSLIDRAVASMLDAGSITIQSYASKMTVTEVGIIATAVSMVVFTQASRFNAEEDKSALQDLTKTGIQFVNTLVVPCCFLTIIFSREIIDVLFGHGEFSEEAVIKTANTMVIYAFGMVGYGFEEILTRIMHATKRRRYPAIVSTAMIFANTGLNLLLYRSMGVYGLALASSLVLTLKIPFYYCYVNKKIVKLNGQGIIADTFKMFSGGLVLWVVMLFVKKGLAVFIHNSFVMLVAGGLISLAVLLVILLAMKNEFALRFIDKIRWKV